ncbi:MAG: TIGR03545 family protein, partial [Thermodesulfobacteriota bacterium]|nr:TIGR03545 family protein [Thermodesulfobacteriota bacterium]
MKKWIRWWGVIVFICLTIFFSFLWFVLVDVVVEHGIERYGMDIVGAKVELDSADVTFFPLGIVLKRLQVTNPESPMTNVVDIARIKFSLDGLNLFRRKVTIDAMSLDEVKINTPRKTSGAITRKSKKAPKGVKKRVEEVLSLPSLKVPDIQEILEKEELRTLELVEKTRADIQVEKERYQKVLNEIPGKERLAQYEKRIDAIKSAKKGDVNSIIGGVSEVASIKKDIERDIRQIQDTQKGLKRTLTTLKGRMDEAVQAPQEDIRRLKSKYALSPEGIGNISRLLLGPRIGDWIDTA